MIRFLTCTLLVAGGWLGGAGAAEIRVETAEAGKLSAAVYDSSGRMVRELARADQVAAGGLDRASRRASHRATTRACNSSIRSRIHASSSAVTL